jgi:sterol desaturase/sphingolipid hydroxylase (fatty acid hydroxylase superfamily)
MTFTDILLSHLNGLFPGVLYWAVLPLVPFIVLEQIHPVGKPPRARDYGLNILILLTTVALSAPLGISAGLWSSQLRQYLPWEPISFTFDSIAAIPLVGPPLEVLAMIFVPLFLHDLWFYWAHRLEHKVPILWEFHKLHHSDENMNTSTWARDHFMQAAWTAFFPAFTLGLVFDLSLAEAGKAALYSNLFLMTLSMFYHSAIRVQLPWLDRILVTPQVHRVHHSIGTEHYNTNFADALPLFDIMFGTYRRPARDEFPATGIGPDSPAPRSIWSAQFGPLWVVFKMLAPSGGVKDASGRTDT